jgi:hypothetical protein
LCYNGDIEKEELTMNIEEFEAQQDAAMVGEEKEKFVVDNIDKANWCLQKIREHEQRKAEIKAYRDAKVKMYNDFYVAEATKDDKEIEFFMACLRPYLEAKTEGAKTKSIAVPEGLIGLRSKPAAIEHDDNLVLPFAKKLDVKFAKVTESLNWAEFKKTLKVDGSLMVTGDGEIVPGITVTEKEDELYYKLKEDKK